MRKRYATLLTVACWSLLPSARCGTAPVGIDGDAVPARIDAAYLRGMDFLAAKQNEFGAWSDSHGSEPGVVGLAVIAFLAHGDDPNLGPYRDTVHAAVGYLLSQQDSESGYIGSSMYNHSFAAAALAEAYGEVDDERIGRALAAAIDLIVRSQSSNQRGAWRYNPGSPDADTTVSGAVMVALMAARNAGMPVPRSVIDSGLAFYRSCQTSDGGFGYVNASGANATRTAIGALVYSLAGQEDTGAYRAAAQYLRQSGYANTDGRPYYYLYYAAQAYFRLGANEWREWNRKNVAWLLALQADDGSWTGQFQSAFSTSAALLSLALNYRYLPIYER